MVILIDEADWNESAVAVKEGIVKTNNKGGMMVLPVIIIAVFFILGNVLPNRTFSKSEKRYLAQCPEFTVEVFINESFGDEFETYFSDQFPCRDVWIGISDYVQKFIFLQQD